MIATILIVEDEAAIQELIGYNLRRAGYESLSVHNAEQAMIILNDALPDLILLDWMLPHMSGTEFARIIRRNERTRLIPIIMLTARTEETDKVTALEIGADDYITKPFSPRELIARIQVVLRRSPQQVAEEVIENNGLRLNPADHRVSCGDTAIKLGPIEFRLLHFMMTHTERVYSRSQLLVQVWGDDTIADERTVDVHIRRLRKALDLVSKDNYIETVRGAGYRFSANISSFVKDSNADI